MSTEQALELLDRVIADYRGTRQDHLNLQIAMKAIKTAIGGSEPTKYEEELGSEPDAES